MLYRGGDIEKNPGSKRALHPRGRDVLVQGVLVQDVLPTVAQQYHVAESELEEYLRVRETFMGSKKLSAGVTIEAGASPSGPSPEPQCLIKSRRVWQCQPGLTTSQSFRCEHSPHSTASCAQQKPTGRWCDVGTLDASLSVRYERVGWDCQHQRHEDAKGCRPRSTAGRAPGMFCDLSAGESDEVPNPCQSPIIGSRRQSGSQLPLSTSPASSESSAVSACPLACFSVLTSPVELKANSSPVRQKEDCSPTAGPCSHHFETESVEECTRSARRRRATECCTHRPASRSVALYHWMTWHKNKGKARRGHDSRTDTHRDGSGRLTQTAVTPWSCCEICVLRVSPVRAQQQASCKAVRIGKRTRRGHFSSAGITDVHSFSGHMDGVEWCVTNVNGATNICEVSNEQEKV